MSGTYAVRLSAPAERGIAALPAKHVDPVIAYVFDRLPLDPYRMSKPLQRELAPWRSSRVGPNMRILFEIVATETGPDLILVHAVDYRSDVYRR